jgi:hypothetical protein
MIILNLVIVGLIVRELINLNEIRKIEEFLNINKNIRSNQITEVELELLNQKYLVIKESISSQNTLGDLIEFIENKSQQYNLRIKETKVISATDEEINYEIEVEGDIQGISSFITDIEEDKNIKDITNSSMKLINNIPNVKISITNKKL